MGGWPSVWMFGSTVGGIQWQSPKPFEGLQLPLKTSLQLGSTTKCGLSLYACLKWLFIHGSELDVKSFAKWVFFLFGVNVLVTFCLQLTLPKHFQWG